MLHGSHEGTTLELRAAGGGAQRLVGRFSYGRTAILSDGGKTGRPQKEKFAPRAFAYSVEHVDESPIHLLVGHSYDKPLASTDTGTLTLQDSDAALTFEAMITPEIAATSYGSDIISMILAGLAIGLSPGFRIPPKRTV